jgi:hypothetical protein
MQDTSSPIEELIEQFHAILKSYEDKPFRPRPEAQEAIDLYRENLARVEKELREEAADWDTLIPRYFETGLTLLLHLTSRPKDRIRLYAYGSSYDPVFDLTIDNNSSLSANDKFPVLQARAERINDCWRQCSALQYDQEKAKRTARQLHSTQPHSKLKWSGKPVELAELFGILHQNGWFQTDSTEAFFRQLVDCFSIVAIDGKEEPAKASSLREMFNRATTEGARQKDSLFKCLKDIKSPRKPT